MNPQKKEEQVLVLDFLPHGKSGEATKEPQAQVVGEINFTLLEVVIRPGTQLQAGMKIYIGRDERKEVDHIKQRINYPDLTTSAQNELQYAIKNIVKQREPEFVAFLNRAGPINIRSHMLELLPGIGKKHLESIVQVRGQKPFESFEDFHARVPHVSSIEDVFTQRILEELRGESKYYLFVKSPKRETDY